MNLEIANRLLELRRSHGYSQEELACRLGVSRQAVSKWERAESSPDTDNLIALARLYGISLDGLLLHTAQEQGGAAQAHSAGETAGQRELEEDREVFAAAQAWYRAESAWEKERKKKFEGTKEKLLLLLALVLMAVLPLVCHLLGVGEIYALVVVIVYLVLGFLVDFWHPGWLLFLSIPIYYYIANQGW